MVSTKARTSSLKSQNSSSQGVRIWTQLKEHEAHDYLFENMPFHEAVNSILNEIQPDKSQSKTYRICLEKREDAIPVNTQQTDQLPELLFSKQIWVEKFEKTNSTASETLIALCNQVNLKCTLTGFDIIFVGELEPQHKEPSIKHPIFED